MLALSRAIAVGARIVIADELSLGLAPRIVEDVFRIIGVMKEQGISIVLIEQFVDRALKLADTCVILGRGKVAWTGSAADARDEVHKQYMGTGDAQPVAGLTS
jgi:branched-chain amino acid transport system ATP-binding protein